MKSPAKGASASGYIYILSNPAMPGLVKIGMSYRSGAVRARELSANTATPSPFILEFEISTKHPEHRERRVHDELDQYRVSGHREFFNVDLSTAVHAVFDQVKHDFIHPMTATQMLIKDMNSATPSTAEVAMAHLANLRALLGHA